MNEQANPPSTDQQLADARIASYNAQVRIAELEKQVVAQRAQIDDLARQLAVLEASAAFQIGSALINAR